MPISVPPQGDKFRRQSSVFATLKVRSQGAPNLTVRISEGGFWANDSKYIEYTGGNSPLFSIPESDSRWVVVALTQSGSIVLSYGAISLNPDLPILTADRLPLAAILLNSTDTVIFSDMVFDLRPFLKVGASVSGISISEITGLQEALDLKANIIDVSSLLALKADINGTPDSVFTLNKDVTGIPITNAVLNVERGDSPDVNIRWNETTDRWEFTNDGSVWSIIGGPGELNEELIEQLVDEAIAALIIDGGEF